MKLLNEILTGLSYQLIGINTREIHHLTLDSRKATQGSIFFAIKGTQTDGHNYVSGAIANGCKTIVCENQPENIAPDVTYICVESSSELAGKMAAAFYDHPSEQLKVVAITGTNGKTTVATLLHQLYTNIGYKVGLLSTVRNKIGSTSLPSTHTTPDSIILQSLLNDMVNSGCSHCFMEASSHAITQDRLSGLKIDIAAFTNITHEHLDYHGTFANYIKAKKQLFDNLSSKAIAISNADDPNGGVMLQNCQARKVKYALHAMVDYKGKIISNSMNGLHLEFNGKEFFTAIVGSFNAYNLLAVYAIANELDDNIDNLLEEISGLEPAEGRMQVVFNPHNATKAIVDYAHSPDALEKVLQTIKKSVPSSSKIITVFGCGGDRDRAKRPQMGKIAVNYSDQVIITSDNPRTENPTSIIEEIWNGIETKFHDKVLKIEDRKQAIRTACKLAVSGDVILVTGKGHEKYQEVNGVKYALDDVEILTEILNPKNRSVA